MRRVAIVLLTLIGCASSLTPRVDAGQLAPPTIFRVTLRSVDSVLVIEGAGLGAHLLTTVDGQPVTTLPGATSSRMEVQAPLSVLSTPGTYRLTVVDPARSVWDSFIVASAAPAVGVGNVTWAPAEPRLATPRNTGRAAVGSHAPTVVTGASDAVFAPRPLAVIEDSATPFRTALGSLALSSNQAAGTNNTAVGYQAMRLNTTGHSNTAVGAQGLDSNTTGFNNVAIGRQALDSNTSGGNNVAIGYAAHFANTAGADNVAIGIGALFSSGLTSRNVAVGRSALVSAVSGAYNVGVGYFAGGDVTGSWNIHVGANVLGQAADANVIRIGNPYDAATLTGQNAAYIAGIRGTTVAGGEGVYIDPAGRLGSGPVVPGANTVGSAEVVADSLTAADLASASVGTAEIADGSVTVAKVGFTFAGLGSNVFTATQTIGNGDLDLDVSSSTKGSITKGGVRFLHDSGTRNTYLGTTAGNFTLTGADNTGAGATSLAALTSGQANTASGSSALANVTAGSGNTGAGHEALLNLDTGIKNTAVGQRAGLNSLAGSHNIYVGADVWGLATDANATRIGLPFDAVSGAGQNKVFLAGVAGTVLTTPAVQVFVDANGQLGTLVPAPITGTGTIDAQAMSRSDATQELAAQRARIDAQNLRIDELLAQLSGLRAEVEALQRRR